MYGVQQAEEVRNVTSFAYVTYEWPINTIYAFDKCTTSGQ